MEGKEGEGGKGTNLGVLCKVSCQERDEAPDSIIMKSDRPVIREVCLSCGTDMFRVGKVQGHVAFNTREAACPTSGHAAFSFVTQATFQANVAPLPQSLLVPRVAAS